MSPALAGFLLSHASSPAVCSLVGAFSSTSQEGLGFWFIARHRRLLTTDGGRLGVLRELDCSPTRERYAHEPGSASLLGVGGFGCGFLGCVVRSDDSEAIGQRRGRGGSGLELPRIARGPRCFSLEREVFWPWGGNSFVILFRFEFWGAEQSVGSSVLEAFHGID